MLNKKGPNFWKQPKGPWAKGLFFECSWIPRLNPEGAPYMDDP